MKNGKTIGMILFVIGLIIIISYSVFEGFNNLSLENINLIVAFGIAAIIVGLLILFITIIFEQQKGKKKMKDEIKKEDLEP